MRILPTSLTRYEMTEIDEDRGHLLNSDTIAVIQNMIADISEKKISLPFTPNDILSYTQLEAELAGQLVILKFLLDRSETASNSIRQRASQSQ